MILQARATKVRKFCPLGQLLLQFGGKHCVLFHRVLQFGQSGMQVYPSGGEAIVFKEMLR